VLNIACAESLSEMPLIGRLLSLGVERRWTTAAAAAAGTGGAAAVAGDAGTDTDADADTDTVALGA
jgi:hypothetical protein